MSETVINNEEQLKTVFKAAFIEVIEEKIYFFKELVEDAIEEIIGLLARYFGVQDLSWTPNTTLLCS
ncbi:MAG: hypothetical protein ABFS56_10800 [Pseudomonadota bacterium]